MRLIDADEFEKRIKPYDTEDSMDKALYNFAHYHLVTTPSAQSEPCEDAVSRKAVEHTLQNGFPARGMWEIEGDVVKQTVCETLADALMDLEKLPSVAPKQQWISVSERLPNTNGIYIVTRRISDGFECRNITDACYFDGSNTWHDDTRVNHERKYLADVLAWSELPDPWKGESDD